jgi:uncharacterized membrane protein HdeD (DUF308 family)
MATSTSPAGLDREVAEALARSWLLFVVTGVFWLVLGFLVLSFRPASISIAVVFMAIVFAMGALSAFAVAWATVGPMRWVAVIVGVLATLAAIGLIVWSHPTLLVISIYVAWYLLIRGIFDVVIALRDTSVKGWWFTLLAGIISIGLGAWAIGNPDRSELLLLTIIGLYAVLHGLADLLVGLHYRGMRAELGVG